MAGLESEPERGARCSKCFAHRFELGCVWAKNNSFDTIASVFGVSKFKDQTQVDNAGIPIAAKFGLKYITAPDDEQLRYKLSKDLYRQKYCGCEFSIRKLTPNT
jgi:predicted adenine nucleotide alpha hydrolase (AANH) superfamily ATPase